MNISEVRNTKVVPLTDFRLSVDKYSKEHQLDPKNDEENVCSDGKEQLSLKGMFRSFTQEAGVTGIRFIGKKETNEVRRFIWTVIVLLALSGLVYQVSSLVLSFFDRPINVNIKYEEPTQKSDFPDLTICNNNLMSYEALLSSIGSVEFMDPIVAYTNTLMQSGSDFYYDEDKSRFDPTSTFADSTFGDKTLLEYFEDLTQDVDDIIRRCSFGGTSCGPQHFTRIVTNYGICYQFNAESFGNRSKVSNAGQEYGLHLLLYANENDYVGPRSEVGFRIMVHDRDEIPDVTGHGVSISPGTSTSIGLTKTMLSNLGPPHGRCADNSSGSLKHVEGAYSLSKCLLECEIDYSLEMCGCRCFFMPENLKKQQDACSSCRQPCEQTTFNMKLSSSSYPSTIYATNLMNYGRWPCDTALYQYLIDNLSKVTIYFEDLKVESIVQQPGYTSFSLVCDIGGSLGLFFGASMVTFLEILDFFIVQCLKKGKARQHRIITVQSTR
ncbi:acid-sensing ion channel 1B-like [Glandiceps talaboti]